MLASVLAGSGVLFSVDYFTCMALYGSVHGMLGSSRINYSRTVVET